ncbi:MAG TPA: hypothetical protein VGS07_09850 [Thermoanaerobaculia bacterium]|nr:hypothetical protein [Thermoanaerobaculia bacterium]
MGGTLFACPVRMILDRCTKIILPAGLKRGAAGSDPVLAQVAPVPVARFRELKYQVFLAYSEVDTGFMRECLNLLNQRGYSIMSSPKALFAESDYDFSDLENSVRQCHTAMLLLSRASLNQLRDRSVQTGRILSILRARTGCVIPVWSGDGAPEVPSDWSLGELLIVDQTEPHAPLVEAMGRLEEVIQSCCPRPDALTIGLPVLILAMTKTEAEELERQPERLRDEFGLNIYQQFVALRSLLQGDESPPLSDRYGLRREDWKPFVTSNRTAWSVLKDIVGDLNRGPHPRSLERLIKLQYYPLVEERSGDELHRIYRQVAQTGCVVLADELSMFHWNIKKAFQAPFYNSEQASLVTLSPVNPSSMAPDRILESELRKKLEVAFNRFNRDYDPRCEFGIGDERRLRRWLHSSLPKTVQNLWNPPPVAQAMDDFFSEQGIGPRP